MSLLQNEDFVLYQLRSSYLSNIRDGIGERLINVNSSVLNNPAFRSSGWVHNPAETKRTYSPPIPTGTASEYFQAPPQSAGLSGPNFGDDDDDDGTMAGGGGSSDTVGPGFNARHRRRKEQLQEDDSSDLSDESEEEEATPGPQRALSKIKFKKMPVRTRAGSSPIRSPSTKDGPSLFVTSPSRPPDSRLRSGSLGTIENMRGRPRRDTVTSSEMSSENESMDSSMLKRRNLNPPRASKTGRRIAENIQEERSGAEELEPNEPDSSEDSDLSSEFGGSDGSNSFLGADDASLVTPLTSEGPHGLARLAERSTSPMKSRSTSQTQIPQVLHIYPPPRPISIVQPKSALTMLLKGTDTSNKDPLERFAAHMGKPDQKPFMIKIYAPFSSTPTDPFEVSLKRTTDDGKPILVADAIGLSLFRYREEKSEPAISDEKLNVNWWTLRMVEEEEVDMDFPALSRANPIQDFTSNNNRAAQGRFRGVPWDEFALVQATEAEYKDNEKTTPGHGGGAKSTQQSAKPAPTAIPQAISTSIRPTPIPSTYVPTPLRGNQITGPVFNLSASSRRPTGALLDAPMPVSHATPRTGARKLLTIHFTDDNLNTRTTVMEVTTDTYLAEVFDNVCKKMHVDKALYVLKLHKTHHLARGDRTVEALQDNTDLDLTRPRFVGDGTFGLSGSPGSSSPNAPLFSIGNPAPAPTTGGKRQKRSATGTNSGALLPSHPLAQAQDAFSLANEMTSFKRWNVMRKAPMSFSSASPRVIALDGDFLYIMSSDSVFGGAGGGAIRGEAGAAGGKPTRLEAAPAKTTTVHLSSIIGCKVSKKHSRMFRVIVFKERQPKRYDFEAQSQAQAAEIVNEIKSMTEHDVG